MRQLTYIRHAKTIPMRKFFVFSILIILLVGAGAFYWRFYFVFKEGVKAGELNKIEKVGVVFKTFEGRLIQTGYRALVPGSVQSNEFVFSIADPAIADSLMLQAGKFVELGYVEYFGALPWRGGTNTVVTKIISIQDNEAAKPLYSK